MLLYLTIATFLFLGVIAKKEQSKFIYLIGLLVLFLFTALRDPVLGGWDAVVYQRFYNRVPGLSSVFSFNSQYGIGYTLLNSIVKSFDGTYISFQITYTVLVFILLWLVLHSLDLSYAQNCLFLFSYFCYRFIWNTWITYRQNLANLIFWIFLIYLYKEIQNLKNLKEHNQDTKKCYLKIFIFLALAIIIPPLFHSSAWVNIVAVPAIFLFAKKKKDSIMLYLIPIISLGLYFLGSPLYSGLISILVRNVDDRYSMYGTGITANSNIVNFIFRLGLYILFVSRLKAHKHKLMPLFISSMAMMIIIGSINAELMTRMYEYYAIGLYSCMALFLDNFEKKSRIAAILIYAAAMLTILVRFLIITDNGLYLNYSLFFT